MKIPKKMIDPKTKLPIQQSNKNLQEYAYNLEKKLETAIIRIKNQQIIIDKMRDICDRRRWGLND